MRSTTRSFRWFRLLGNNLIKVFDEANQAVLPQRTRQKPHGGVAHTEPSLEVGSGVYRYLFPSSRCRTSKRRHKTTNRQAEQA